jgi:diadenosine tetraphosphate (Ap4A) HIT family hydrolase
MLIFWANILALLFSFFVAGALLGAILSRRSRRSQPGDHGRAESDEKENAGEKYTDLLGKKRPCPFDSPKESDIIAQNRTAYLTYSIAGYHRDQLLAIPRRHLTGLEEMSEEEIKDCEELQKLGWELLKHLGHGGVNFLLREGDPTGKTIPHLHYNIMPDTRLGDMSAEGQERREVMNDAEIVATVSRLREALARLPV